MSRYSDVHIRPYRVGDAPAVYEAVQESVAALQPWMLWCHPRYSLDEARSWLETQVRALEDRTAFELAIVSADEQYLGGCGLNQIDTANRRANLGYWVRTSATRQGVATRAVCAIRDWAFEHTDLLRLEIVIAVGNEASQRVATKAGATKEGVLRNRLLLHSAIRDATMFSFVKTIAASAGEQRAPSS